MSAADGARFTRDHAAESADDPRPLLGPDQAACTPSAQLPELRRRLLALTGGPTLADGDRPYTSLSSEYTGIRLFKPFDTPANIVNSKPPFAGASDHERKDEWWVFAGWLVRYDGYDVDGRKISQV